MMNDNLEYLHYKIKLDCLNLINEKKVDISALAFNLGLSENEFVKMFTQECEDFAFYLKTYDTLLGW